MIFHQSLKSVFLIVVYLSLASTSYGQSVEQGIKVDLRTIGHQFLLQLKDSTSRILPIEKKDGRYAVQFERDFSFEPDQLVVSTFNVMEASTIKATYIVEVEQCETHELVYSFRATANRKSSILSCKQRGLPQDCYIFYFTVIENNLPVQEKLMVNEASPKSEVNSASASWLNELIGIGGLAAVIGMFFMVKRQKKKPLAVNNLIEIGQFQYDQKGMLLLLKERSIELSSKESDLLYLLYSNENKTLKREDILKLVWGDEGDYVGRTLDVFISKLRKKLEADTSLKIVNIRGVGYRFVIHEIT